jgi:signal transduction histidine kinase
MGRGRATRGGQKPTAPTTRLIRGYSRINAYYAARLGLRSTRERAEVLGGSLHLDTRPGAGTRVELRVPLDGRQPQQPSEVSP